MSFPLFQVDAFTSTPFSGNPAAVCLLAEPATPAWMQSVAREMNLSETAYVVPQRGRFVLRWFTPTTEVDLCGHATLAAAHVLWETGTLGPGAEAQFQTRSGLLTARQDGDLVELDFPVKVPRVIDLPPSAPPAVGLAPRAAARAGDVLLLEMESEEHVRRMQPIMQLVRGLDAAMVVVTARSQHPDYLVVSRCFAPRLGIPEDPVTGSAHCAIAPYWAPVLQTAAFTAFQASARGGLVRVRLAEQRVFLAGAAVTVLRGQLL